jgi:hypothetical protein
MIWRSDGWVGADAGWVVLQHQEEADFSAALHTMKP